MLILLLVAALAVFFRIAVTDAKGTTIHFSLASNERISFTFLDYLAFKSAFLQFNQPTIVLWYTGKLPSDANTWWKLAKPYLALVQQVVLESNFKGCSKKALARYIGLEKIFTYGGIYLDPEFIFFKPILSLLSSTSLALGNQDDKGKAELSCSFIYSAKPGHPFLRDMLEFYENYCVNSPSSEAITTDDFLNVKLPSRLWRKYLAEVTVLHRKRLFISEEDYHNVSSEIVTIDPERHAHKIGKTGLELYQVLYPENIYIIFHENTPFHIIIRPYLYNLYAPWLTLHGGLRQVCLQNFCGNIREVVQGECFERDHAKRVKNNEIRVYPIRIPGFHRHFGYYYEANNFCLKFSRSDGQLLDNVLYLPTKDLLPWMSIKENEAIMPMRKHEQVLFNGDVSQFSFWLRNVKPIPYSALDLNSCYVEGTVLALEDRREFSDDYGKFLQVVGKYFLFVQDMIRYVEGILPLRQRFSFNGWQLKALRGAFGELGDEDEDLPLMMNHTWIKSRLKDPDCKGKKYLCFEQGIFPQFVQGIFLSKPHAEHLRQKVEDFCSIKRTTRHSAVVGFLEHSDGMEISNINELAKTVENIGLATKIIKIDRITEFCQYARTFAEVDIVVSSPSAHLFGIIFMNSFSVAIEFRPSGQPASEVKVAAYYCNINYLESEDGTLQGPSSMNLPKDDFSRYLSYALQIWRSQSYQRSPCLQPASFNPTPEKLSKRNHEINHALCVPPIP